MPHPNVPLIDLRAQYATIKAEVEAAMAEVLESQHFILGPVVAALEQEIAEYCSTAHAVGCASGSDAIMLALMAVGFRPGDEVICPAYTFFATAGSLAHIGAVPVFADVDPITLNIDPEHVRRLAKRCERLRAIMPVHLYGQVADMDALEAVAAEAGVPIIEDAAQAIGARDNDGAPAGSRGIMGCFSFFPTKNLGAFGDGGIITTNHADMAERLRMLRVHGSRQRYYNEAVGVNSRLDALQAAVLRVKLRHLESWHDARRRNADRYDAILHEHGAASSDVPFDGGTLPVRTPVRPAPPARHIFNQYVIRVPAELRDPLREHLRGRAIASEIYYPVPLHLQECFRELGGREGDLPHSEAAARETLALPIYPELTDGQLDHVATSIVEFARQHAAVSA